MVTDLVALYLFLTLILHDKSCVMCVLSVDSCSFAIANGPQTASFVARGQYSTTFYENKVNLHISSQCKLSVYFSTASVKTKATNSKHSIYFVPYLVTQIIQSYNCCPFIIHTKPPQIHFSVRQGPLGDYELILFLVTLLCLIKKCHTFIQINL